MGGADNLRYDVATRRVNVGCGDDEKTGAIAMIDATIKHASTKSTSWAVSRSHFNISPAVFSPHKKGAGPAHLEAQGHAPQVDYAPISLEVVKALEVEFGKVLDGFRKTVNGRAFSYNEGEISDRGLSDFLQGEKPPTLGTIAYLLSQPKPNASKLRLAIHTYLAGLPNGAFLTSKAFAHKGLQRV